MLEMTVLGFKRELMVNGEIFATDRLERAEIRHINELTWHQPFPKKSAEDGGFPLGLGPV